MFGLTRKELRFSILISTSHFSQHVYNRILPPLIPILAVALRYPLWQLGLLLTIFQIGGGVSQAPMGVLSDRVDRRYLLPTGIIVAGAAYSTFAFAGVLGEPLPAVTVFGTTFAGDFIVMSLAMLLAGVGIAVVHPVGYPMITDNVRDGSKGKVLGYFGASSKLGDAVTPAAIAGLVLVLAWQEIVLLLGVGGILYGIALFGALHGDTFETVPSGQRSEDTDEPSESIGETDRRTYLYPLTVIYVFFISSIWTSRGISAFFPTFLVAVYSYSAEVMGVQLGPESVANVYFALLLFAGAVMQVYLGGLTDTYDPRLVLLGCMGLATVGIIVLAVVPLTPMFLLIVVIILGTGLYGNNPPRDALISNISPSDREGRTFGYIFTAAVLTAAPFPTAIGYLLETVGMREGYLVLGIGSVLAGAAIMLLYSERVYLRGANERPTADVSD